MAMKTFTDEELYDDAKFDQWNEVLAPLGRLRCQGRLGTQGTGAELVGPLYDVALEVRDRLRFSQLRTHQLKSELRKVQGLLNMERQLAAETMAGESMQAQAALRQVHEELQCERERSEAAAAAAAEQLRAERERSRSALEQQQGRARDQLVAECQAAQEHAAAECQRAHSALKQAQEELRAERARATDDVLHERQRAAARQASLEAEVRHLNQAVKDQAAQIAAYERMQADLQAQLAAARQDMQAQVAAARHHTDSAAVQADQAEERADQERERADRAEAARRAMAAEVQALRAELDRWRGKAADNEGRHDDAMQALLATKHQLGELSHLQGLYLAAREELDRLDKENAELKDMIQAEVYDLTSSRILETMSPSRPDKSTPLFMTPEMIGRRRPRAGRSTRRSVSPGRDRVLAATGVIYPADLAADIETYAGAARGPQHPAGPADGLPHVAEAAHLARLAFLGPPTSSYPTDPDKFVFVRVAGGFSPKYIGSDPLPKASGWIPKDVVRLAQAFKHSHSITTDWRYWEPFLLMVNEVYHPGGAGARYAYRPGSGATIQYNGSSNSHGGGGRARSPGPAVRRPASARTASPPTGMYARDVDDSEATRKYMSRLASYPSVVQAGRIMALRRELASAGRSRGRSRAAAARDERERDDFVRGMAEKDYHIMNELGEVVGENQRLRRTLNYEE